VPLQRFVFFLGRGTDSGAIYNFYWLTHLVSGQPHCDSFSNTRPRQSTGVLLMRHCPNCIRSASTLH